MYSMYVLLIEEEINSFPNLQCVNRLHTVILLLHYTLTKYIADTVRPHNWHV
jgi:hypothetical protein